MKSNIWKFTLHKAVLTRTYMPILAVYLLTFPDTSSKTVGMILLVASIGSILFEIPSGYLSDKIGHKKALILARTALAISTFCFFASTSILWFIIGAIFLSLGRAFISGTTAAFMHETLLALGRDQEYSKIMGRMSSLCNAISVIFIITIPLLVNISYQAAFALPLFLDLIGIVAVSLLVQPKKTQVQIDEISNTNFITVLKESYKRNLLPYLLLTAFMMIAISATEDFREVYYQALTIDVMYFGIFAAISQLLISFFLLFNDSIKQRLSINQFMLMKFAGAIVLIGALGFIQNIILIVIITIFVAAYNIGFIEAENNYLLDMMKESNFKATILSMKGLVYEGLVGIMGLLMGFIITSQSFYSAFFYNALILAVVGIVTFGWILIGNHHTKTT